MLESSHVFCKLPEYCIAGYFCRMLILAFSAVNNKMKWFNSLIVVKWRILKTHINAKYYTCKNNPLYIAIPLPVHVKFNILSDDTWLFVSDCLYNQHILTDCLLKLGNCYSLIDKSLTFNKLLDIIHETIKQSSIQSSNFENILILTTYTL